uniref:MFS domain-containing protein n=3 Tax=Caenorhabditis tropicalis TaxID=1561998 RepID=A0A1I7UUV1_9PELO
MYVMSFVQLNLNKTCRIGNETVKIGQTCEIEEDPGARWSEWNGEYCGLVNETKVEISNHNARTNLLIEFSLHCSHWFFQEFGLTIFTIGAVVAVPFMSMLADRYGRKPIIVATAIVAFLANLAASFSPNYAIFLVLRAIVGASSDTYLSVGSVATCEYISEKARAWITVVYNVAWSLGMVWTLLVTLMTTDWRWRYFIVVFPGVYAFVLWACLPESPHWLIVKNRTERLKKYIKTANRINKKTPDFRECQQNSHHDEKHEGLKALSRSKKLIWILFANGFIEMVISLVYFAISFLCVVLGDDHVTAFLYSSIIEIPAGLAVLPLMMAMGRKTIVIWCLVFQTLSLIGVTVFLDVYSMKLGMMLVAKVMATIIYSVHPIWANEQFPTSVRSLCFSLMNVPQSMGIIMSPYLKHIAISPNWLPFTVIALFSFISATIAFMLNETKNVKLPTDVESLSNPGEAADLSEFVSSPSSSSTSSKTETE